MQRIVDVFGRKLQPQLIPIKEDIIWCKLHGFVAKPEGAKKTRGEQFLLSTEDILKAHISIKRFRKLLKDCFYRDMFLRFSFLELDPEKIDVNIHPQKTEVKFEDEHLIFALLRSTIKRSLGIYNVSPSLDFEKIRTG
jgi:DNA mismatch repair protein MutL